MNCIVNNGGLSIIMFDNRTEGGDFTHRSVSSLTLKDDGTVIMDLTTNDVSFTDFSEITCFRKVL